MEPTKISPETTADIATNGIALALLVALLLASPTAAYLWIMVSVAFSMPKSRNDK